MASFVLVPGAGGMSWYWHRAVPLIRGAGHEPIAVDLPGDDNRAGQTDDRRHLGHHQQRDGVDHQDDRRLHAPVAASAP